MSNAKTHYTLQTVRTGKALPTTINAGTDVKALREQAEMLIQLGYHKSGNLEIISTERIYVEQGAGGKGDAGGAE